MKKSIIMTIIVAMVLSLVSFASIVNAVDNTAKVSLSVDKTSVKKGDTVTVTIHSDKVVQGARLTVKYDQKLLQFVSASPSTPGTENTTADGTTIEFVNANGMNDLTISFKVIGTKGSTAISATPIEFNKDDNTPAYDVKTISGVKTVKIEEKTTTTKPSTNSTSTKPSTNSTSTKPSTNSSSSTSKAPTKYPNTGYSVVALGASVVAIIALGAISVKVFKK